jgi:hypothetical protein
MTLVLASPTLVDVNARRAIALKAAVTGAEVEFTREDVSL